MIDWPGPRLPSLALNWITDADSPGKGTRLKKSQRMYNVGNEDSLSIAEMARSVAEQFQPAMEIETRGKVDANKPLERYVPATARAKNELGLDALIQLNEAIERTIVFYRQKDSPPTTLSTSLH